MQFSNDKSKRIEVKRISNGKNQMAASRKPLTIEDLQIIVDSVDEVLHNPGPMDMDAEDFAATFIPSLTNVNLVFEYTDLSELNPKPDFFHFDERSFYALALILNKWMLANPDKIMSDLGSRILVHKHRLLILTAISGDIPSRYRVEILETLLPIVNNFSHDEIEALIYALLENSTSETVSILHKIQETLVSPAKSVSIMLSEILNEKF